MILVCLIWEIVRIDSITISTLTNLIDIDIDIDTVSTVAIVAVTVHSYMCIRVVEKNTLYDAAMT